MKPAPFTLLQPRSLPEALSMLAGEPDPKILAGGQSLVPAMNFRLARFTTLIDINRIADLSGIARVNGAIRFGATVRQRTVERDPVVAAAAPLVQQATWFIAHLPIRTRGTLGGSISHADPAAEYPAALLALDARLLLRSRRGERTVPVTEFFRGVFTTALDPDEMLVAVDVPASGPDQVTAFDEISRRPGDFAIAGVALNLNAAGGHVSAARLAACGVGPTAVRLSRAEQALLEPGALVDRIEAAAAAAAAEILPGSDLHATAEYRRHLLGVLVRRTLRRALKVG